MASDGESGGADDLSGLFGGSGGGTDGEGAAETTGGGDGDGAEAEGGRDGFVAPEFFDKVSAEPGEGDTVSNRDWLTAKGFRDLDAVVKSARHAEKALHDKGMIAVPKDGASEEAVAAFRKAIGVPDDAKGYEISGPDGVELNQPLIDRLAGAAQRAGIPKAAFEKTVGEFIQAQLDEQHGAEQALQGQVDDKLKEWGAKRTENEAHLLAATRALGLNRADQLWFRTMPGGAGRALDLLVKLGSGMSEDALTTGGKGSFGIDGAGAQAAIDAMKADPETAKKILIAGSPERARYERLNKAAADYRTMKDAA